MDHISAQLKPKKQKKRRNEEKEQMQQIETGYK